MNQKIKVDTGTMIAAVLGIVLFFVAAFYIVGGIFKLLTWAAPVLLILALIVNYRTVLNYGEWLINMIKAKPLVGIGAVLLTVLLYPIVFSYLLIRAYLSRKLKAMQAQYEEQTQGKYVDFEIMEEKPLRIDIPPRERRQK